MRSGSSPLARGLLAAPPGHDVEAGIIPARAGFTRHRPVVRSGRRDHPRSRGVYVARGQGLLVGQGIIPARAGFTRCADGGQGRGPDHPRSRGVYLGEPATDAPAPGSSPLARGLPIQDTGQDVNWRIIPARAGFTGPRHRLRPAAADHPRSRGVYKRVAPTGTPSSGSSPLARGLLAGGASAVDQARIIPARAGFTGRRTRRRCQRGDHPRSRGVYGPTSWEGR